MKWPSQLKAAQATKHPLRFACGECVARDQAERSIAMHLERRIALYLHGRHKNRLVAVTRDVGDNHLRADNIRNSISLTIIRLRRIISASQSIAKRRRELV
jgi:hypothetical protein